MERTVGGLRGVTLIELLVTITVVGVLAAIALPSFSTMTKNSRLATETNDLMADLAFSRSEAARRGKRVTLCVSGNGTGCGSGAAWEGGRIIFSDSATHGAVDTGDEILRVNQSVASKNISITTSGFSVAATSTLNYIQFKPSGALNSDSPGVFKICDDRVGSFGRTVSVSPQGRTSLTSTTASCP